VKAQRLEREIEVVEHIIDQLNKCFIIYSQNKMRSEIKNTLKDIQLCKAELKRLIAAKEAEMGV